MVSFEAHNIDFPTIDMDKTSNWIKEVCRKHLKKTGKIHYIFCNDEKILEVNKQYLNHDYYTDIITFDYTENNVISGDIFISLDTVKSNAAELNESFSKELLRIIIHGILHLCGQDDKKPDDKTEMTRKENQALDLWYNEN
jgi:rRNA maturation RNase YbeY